MIPDMNETYESDTEHSDFVEEIETSRTYRLDNENCSVIGKCDDEEAINQAIYKILHTERYSCEIYSWDYGIELQDLYGEDIEYVIAELPYRIKESLEQDDRIESVDDFEIEQSGKRSALCKFKVYTVKGDEFHSKYQYNEGSVA